MYIYISDLCIFVHKNSNLFKQFKDTHNINTRHKNKLYLPPSRLKMLNTSPYYMAIKIYNKLPQDIKNIINPCKFQSSLNKYLKQNPFYSVIEYLEHKNN
jgi:hypothetical protein